MNTERASRRAVIFIDGQNLFRSAKEAFGHSYPNCDPLALARTICIREGWELSQVRLYTGYPDAEDNPFWNHFWTSKFAQMGIDATTWFRPLRKNMGKKNCKLAAEDIQRTCDTFLAFEETPQSKIFPNAAFGYWKVKVERTLRLHNQLTRPRIEPLRYASGDEDIRAALYAELGDPLFTDPTSVPPQLEKLVNDWGKADSEGDEDEEGEADTPKKSLSDKKKKKLLSEATWKRDAMLLDVSNQLRKALGDELYDDYNVFLERVEAALKQLGLKPSAAELKLIVNAVSWRVEDATRVTRKIHKPGKAQPDPLRGLFEADTKIGYEVSFTRHFYQPPQLRTLAQISADILALEEETEGLLNEITKGVTA